MAGEGEPPAHKGRQWKGVHKASAVQQTGGGVCECGLAHPSPHLGAVFACKGEGVERVEAGGGNRVLPMVGNDTQRHIVFTLFAFILFIVFCFFLLWQKKKSKKAEFKSE